MWISRFKRFVTVGLAIFAVLFCVQLLKGYESATAARFAVIWAAVSASLFVVTGMYYARRKNDCPICNEPMTRPTSEKR